MIGDVSFYLNAPAEAKPLTKDTPLQPGMTVQTGKDAQATLKTPGETRAALGADTQVKLAAPQDGKQALELHRGSLDVSRKQGLPGFDDLNVRTQDATATGAGTRYRISVSERGTTYEVLEGRVRVTGALLSRTDEHFEAVGKRALVEALDLAAGDRAIAFRAGSGARPALPSWVSGGSAAPSAASALSRPDPWNDPRVQALMDEWLRSATPTIAAQRPGRWTYTLWAQVEGPGVTAAGAPDHPAGWTRYQSLWPVRMKYDSLDLCTLGDFVDKRLRGESLDGCRKSGGMPSWLSKPPAAPPPSARLAPPAPAARPAAPEPAASPAAAEPPPAAAPQPRVWPGIVDRWNCLLTQPGTGKTSPVDFTLVRSNSGYTVVNHTDLGDVPIPSVKIENGAVTFRRHLETATLTLTLERSGAGLSGIDRMDQDDGRSAAYPISCRRKFSKRD